MKLLIMCLRVLSSFALIVSLITIHAKANRYEKKKTTEVSASPKSLILNTDGFPTITEILQELQMSKYLPNFVSIGITDTRLLLRLQSMDFQIMSYDWELPDDDIARLRSHIRILVEKAAVQEEDIAVQPDYSSRNKLQYGRVYMPSCVQSFEYKQASFGAPPPIGPLQIVLSDPLDGCLAQFTKNENSLNDEGSTGAIENENTGLFPTKQLLENTGKVLIVMRGGCNFLEKAVHAAQTNASALLIVNDKDELESSSSGLGVDKSVSQSTVNKVTKLSIVSLSNTSIAKIMYSLKAAGDSPIFLHIVPLLCGLNGSCLPILPEEKTVLPEVTSGILRLQSDKGEMNSFEYLTANYGGVLPNWPFLIIIPEDMDSCSELKINTEIIFGSDFDSKNSIINYKIINDNSENKNDSSNIKKNKSANNTSLQYSENKVIINTYEQTNNNKNKNKKPFAVVLNRGGCSFSDKAFNAQNAGASLLIVVDALDSPLQRMGGTPPVSGYVGIPSIMVSKSCGDFITKNSLDFKNNNKEVFIDNNVLVLETQDIEVQNIKLNEEIIKSQKTHGKTKTRSFSIIGELTPSENALGYDRWVEVAHTEWEEKAKDQLTQIKGLIRKYSQSESFEIVAWLRRRSAKLDNELTRREEL